MNDLPIKHKLSDEATPGDDGIYDSSYIPSMSEYHGRGRTTGVLPYDAAWSKWNVSEYIENVTLPTVSSGGPGPLPYPIASTNSPGQ